MEVAPESSRIFVRGLPPKYTEDDVKKHFSKYAVTDVKFFPHRRIGYVGYRTPEDAAQAVKYFNKTFVRQSKIYVEIARPIADKALPKSRRQLKEENSLPKKDEYVPPPRENALKRKRDEAEQDPKLKEFLNMMQPPSKLKSWANEDLLLAPEATPAADVTHTANISEGESDGEYQVINKKPRSAQDNKSTATEARTLPAPVLVADEKPSEKPDIEQATHEVSQAPAGEGGLVSDADWLRSRTNRVLDLVEDDEDLTRNVTRPSTIEDEGFTTPKVEAEPAEPPQPAEVEIEEVLPSEEDKMRQTGRLYLRNLHFDVTEDDIRDYFSTCGAIEEIHVPTKKSDGKGKGFAFVQFQDPDHAVEAYLDKDGTIFQGRLLHIISANSKKDNILDDFAIAKLPLKKQREIKRKSEAAKQTFNWNSLYLNADAVMSTVADRMGISKAELMDPTSADAAIKQAHAETHIIQETKSYFAQHGVDLEAFKKSSKSDVAILVKNIPHRTSPDEVRKLFEEHGTVKQFLMPPAGMTAIIGFENAAAGKSAFMSLAYRKMKDSILYLEKAPKNLFKEGFVMPILSQPAPVNKVGTKLSATDLLQDAPEPESTTNATLYVRNLNFTTTTELLTQTFSPLEGFRNAKVQTKNDPKRGLLSMGFGFVEFNSAQTASAALRAMDHYELEGHKLQIKASHSGVDAAEERRKEDAAKKAAGTKILVKNLPFEAGKKDVRALFAPYGALRSVRVPKKFDSSSRGFAFAEFLTKRDAANAIEALRNTHLLGRRLVLAFAEAESDDPEKELEKMQQKVGAQANKVALQRLTGGGRKKFNVAGNEDDPDED